MSGPLARTLSGASSPEALDAPVRVLAFQNLLLNALTFAGDPGWLEVRVERSVGQRQRLARPFVPETAPQDPRRSGQTWRAA